MKKVILIHDVYNDRWLQNPEEPYDPMVWVEEKSDASWFEPERLGELLKRIDKESESEVWIHPVTIYVNSI